MFLSIELPSYATPVTPREHKVRLTCPAMSRWDADSHACSHTSSVAHTNSLAPVSLHRGGIKIVECCLFFMHESSNMRLAADKGGLRIEAQ